MAAITLYDLAGFDDALRISPFCWRARMALAHKGLQVETVPWRMVEKEVIRRSSCTTVPVIVDGGQMIGESWLIAEYLDEAYPDEPLFDSFQAKAYCRWIQHWTDRTLHQLIVPLILEDVLAVLHPKDREYFRRSREAAYRKPLENVFDSSPAAHARLTHALSPMRRLLRENTCIAGEAPAYGDYILFGMFQWARSCSNKQLLTEEQDPIAKWFERMLDLFGGLARSAATPADLRLRSEIS